MKYKITTFIIMALIFMTLSFSVIAQQPADITNHWAQDYILNLLKRNIMQLDDSGNFNPDKKITRIDFGRALARQLNLTPVYEELYNDLSNYNDAGLINALNENNIMNGIGNNTFNPENFITQAQAIKVIVKAAGIKSEQEIINLYDYNSFTPIPNSDPNSNYIKIAEKIGIIDLEKPDRINPDMSLTRAEAARFISRLNLTQSNTGYISDIYPASGKIAVNLLSGQRRIFNINDETLVGRNNRIVKLDEIQQTDKIFFVANNADNLKYIKAYGMITKEDLAVEVSRITDGVLSTEEVKQLANGQYDFLGPKLTSQVEEVMLNNGLTEAEVTAIFNTNWDELNNLSRNRLSEAFAMQTGLPLDITKSILSGDWDKIKSYAEVELVQRLVMQMLSAELIS